MTKRTIRLQKYMALCGVASRRNSEELILTGAVQVNGQTIRTLGTKVSSDDVITLKGERISLEEEKRYVLYYKPMGEVTTVSDPKGRDTVMDHFIDYPVRLYPVGRLDYDSEGLLILTNDGDLTQRLTHPSHEVSKTYIVRLSMEVTPKEVAMLAGGVYIDGRKTAPAKVRVLRKDAFSTDLLISIHEGRNRQIRKMAEAVGHSVVRLKRVGYGPLSLKNMVRGTWRELTEEEVQALKNL